MKSLVHSRLISGMLIGAIPGGLLLLFSMGEVSQRTACLILIGVGSTLGLLAGLAADIEPQIKWAPDHRLRRTWRSVSVQFIRNRLRHGFGSQSLSIFLVCSTVLLWGCVKWPVTKYWSWSLTVDKPNLEFYQRSPTTTEIFRRVKFTSAVTVGAWIGIAMLRALVLRNQQGFISDNMTQPETADVAMPVYQRRFGRRTILLPFVGICMCAGWLVWNLRAANQQQQIVSLVFQLGGGVSYDFEANPGAWQANGPPPEPAWLVKVLGIDFFHNVVQVDLYPERPPTKTVNALLPQLRHLTRLRSLALSDGEFHDEDIKSLVGLNDLEYVWLDSKQITDASVETIAELSSLRRISVELSANGKFRLRQLRPNLYVY